MLLNFILIIVLIICFITDLKYQKIYNKVIFPCVIMGLVLHFIISGFNGLRFSLIGFGVGLFILLIPYFLGGIGAGDVKLLALIGTLKGSTFVVNTTLYMGVIGGLMALIVILSHKESLKYVKDFLRWGVFYIVGLKYRPAPPKEVLLKKYPYGLAIVSAAFICLIFKEAWLIS